MNRDFLQKNQVVTVFAYGDFLPRLVKIVVKVRSNRPVASSRHSKFPGGFFEPLGLLSLSVSLGPFLRRFLQITVKMPLPHTHPCSRYLIARLKFPPRPGS